MSLIKICTPLSTTFVGSLNSVQPPNKSLRSRYDNLLSVTPKEPLAKSITPAVGLVTSPTTPFPNPLKNPSTPSSFAPDKGFITTPVTPSTTPYFKAAIPLPAKAKCIPIAPVIFDTAPAIPPTVWPNMLRTPRNRPSANSPGPCMAP
ncbi:hypothetical protein ALC62_03981 [Cyphomyrmex costatus]|uniref:Uncharacterized protein n=1 Tax=Cyphomyrmex costatus TaxID=456900 RepID=A0A195CX06_9HYME|nr:hypothetical protein ALC62_03981 [Cyphomyrmex costatus]